LDSCSVSEAEGVDGVMVYVGVEVLRAAGTGRPPKDGLGEAGVVLEEVTVDVEKAGLVSAHAAPQTAKFTSNTQDGHIKRREK